MIFTSIININFTLFMTQRSSHWSVFDQWRSIQMRRPTYPSQNQFAEPERTACLVSLEHVELPRVKPSTYWVQVRWAKHYTIAPDGESMWTRYTTILTMVGFLIGNHVISVKRRIQYIIAEGKDEFSSEIGFNNLNVCCSDAECD